jgi:hypothetical protein
VTISQGSNTYGRITKANQAARRKAGFLASNEDWMVEEALGGNTAATVWGEAVARSAGIVVRFVGHYLRPAHPSLAVRRSRLSTPEGAGWHLTTDETSNIANLPGGVTRSHFVEVKCE